MGDGLLGKERYLLGGPDQPKDPFVGPEVADGASKGTPVKLSQGDLADSVACGICIECNIKKSEPSYEQLTTMAHVEQTNGRKWALTI